MSNRKKKRKMSANAKWGIALFIEIVVLVVMTICYVFYWIGSKYDNVDVLEIKK